jgi:hypothetical protein
LFARAAALEILVEHGEIGIEAAFAALLPAMRALVEQRRVA